jgi:hypothetical protein
MTRYPFLVGLAVDAARRLATTGTHLNDANRKGTQETRDWRPKDIASRSTVSYRMIIA